ncbi:YbbR-like protein [bacterium BMS3Bbin04]|nr:YbbR-like protein [bacterium BMS3Bbin04]
MNLWKRIQKNWHIRVYMLLLAILLWVVVVMTQVYETTVNVPVRALNISPDMILVSELPETIPVRFSGQGKDLFVLTFFRPAHLDLDMQVVDKDFDYPLHTGLIEVPVGLAVEPMILPGQNVISVSLEERVTVLLPVQPDVEVRTRPGYIASETTNVMPDSVRVTGPKSIVERMKNVLTEERVYIGISDSFVENVELLSPERVDLLPASVQLGITVNRLGERVLKRVPLFASGFTPGWQIILEPSVVDVRVKGISTRLATLTPDSIRAWVNLSNWDRNQFEYTPEFDLPEGVELIDVTPGRIRVRAEVDSWQ